MNNRKEAIRQELMRRGVIPSQQPISENSDRKAAIKAELERRGMIPSAKKDSFTPEEKAHYQEHLKNVKGEEVKANPKQMAINAVNFRAEHPEMANLSDEEIHQIRQESRAHRGRILAQDIAKAPLRALDLPQALASLATGFNYQPDYISNKAIAALKERGIDLNKEQPLSPAEQTVSTGTQWGAGALAGAGIGGVASKALGATAKAVPAYSSGLGKAQKGTEFLYGVPGSAAEMAKWTGASAGLGAGAGALEGYGGVSPEKASLLGLVPAIPAAYQAAKAIPKAANLVRPSKLGERQAEKKLVDVIGKENISDTRKKIAELEEKPSVIGHKPVTAESGVPGISQLHTALEGEIKHPEMKEGLSQRKEANRLAKEEAINTLGPSESYSTEEAGEAIRGGLEKELGKRISERKKLVGEEYEQLKNIPDRITPEGALSYIQKELQEISPQSKLSKPLEHAKRLIEGDKSQHIELPNGKTRILPLKISQLEKSISEISEDAKKASMAGDYSEARILNNVVSELYKDLESSHPEVKETRAKYKEASKPINTITEDPFFKKILKQSKYGAHEVKISEVPSRFVHSALSSPSNTKAIKDVIGHDKDAWSKFQAGAANVVSANSHTPDKFLKFFGKRREALKEIFNEKQYKALDEIKDLYAAERKIQKQAKTEGSPTAQRLAIKKTIEDSPLDNTFLQKILTPTMGAVLGGQAGGLPGAITAAGASFLGNYWNNIRKQSFQKTIQRFLLNPDEASLLLKKYDKSGIKEANEIAKKISKQRLGNVPRTSSKKSKTIIQGNEEEE